jgi:uncharacterized protein involved in exopolysaccharide biosynthesis/Mrp family chromosome partitioning ATPase
MGNSFPSSGEGKPFFRLDIPRSLQLHRRLATGIALVGIVLAVAYVVKTWPVYSAQSQIYIQPVEPKVLEQPNANRWPFDSNTYDSYIQQQVQSAANPEVLLSALHKMGTHTWQEPDESEQAAARRLGGAVQAARIGNSYQVTITSKASNADLSALIANAVAAAVVERASHEENAGDIQRIAVLRDERDRINKEMEADRTEQETLNSQLGVAAVGTAAPDLIDDDISRTRTELIKARTDHDEAAAKYTAMEAGRGGSSAEIDAEADELVAADAGLTSMKTSLNQRRAMLITQMANMKPDNPAYKQGAEELAKINSTLEATMKDLRSRAAARIQTRLRMDLERTGGVEAQLNGQLRKLTGAAASATPKLQRANDLAADMLRLRARYATVDEQLHNLTLQDSVPGAVHLSVAAVAPSFPSISGVLKIALPLAFGGVILGLLAALIANNLDNKIYIAADVERVLGFAPMAVLPDFNQVTDGVAEEHLLRLSASIEYARQQGHLKSCIFTGTGPDAGVTTVATKVRSMLEGMGRSTVLVDATGTPPPPQRSSYAEAGRQETSSQLSIQRGGRSTALVQKLAQEAETKEEVLVLTDAAPLVVSAETEYLARFVDAAIVVVESGVTTRKELREAAGVLQRLDVAAVGFVLNRVGLEKADPSFRQSVRAVEQHLQAQSLSFSRGPERNMPSPPVMKIQQDQASKAVAATAQAATALPKPVAEAATRAAAPAVPEMTATPSRPASFEPLIPKPSRIEELVQRGSHPAMPAAPMPLVREKPLTEQPEVFRRPVPSPEVKANVADGAEDKVFSAAEFETPAKPKAVRQAPPYPQTAWAESWKRVSPSQNEIQNKPAPAESQEAELAEAPYDATTRMSGLRNLIFSLGLKNSPAAETAVEPVSQPSPAVEPVHERPVYDSTYSQSEQMPVREETGAKSATVVTAPPEILPPRVFEVETDNDRTRNNAAAARRDRRDAFDEDVQILPSWRGQYRKKL